MEDKIFEMEKRIKNEEYTGQQCLGKFLIIVGIAYAIELIGKGIFRQMFEGQTLVIGAYETYCSILRMCIVIIAIVYTLVKMKRLFFHYPGNSKLMILWGVILVPIQLINDTCVMLYTRMLEIVQHALVQSEMDPDGKIFALVYDLTHGFKYICIFLAILLGILVTGLILEKKPLIIAPIVIAIMFMIAFALFRMSTVTINSIVTAEIGINWTSLLFHALTTLGLIGVGWYITYSFRKEAVEPACIEGEKAAADEEA